MNRKLLQSRFATIVHDNICTRYVDVWFLTCMLAVLRIINFGFFGVVCPLYRMSSHLSINCCQCCCLSMNLTCKLHSNYKVIHQVNVKYTQTTYML